MKSTLCGLLLTSAWTVCLFGQRPPEASSILSATHAALGGDARITGLKSLVITGRTRQVRGDNLIPIEFEIDLVVPDRYVRREEIPAQGSGPTVRGFNGTAIIQPPPGGPGAPGGRGGPPPPGGGAAGPGGRGGNAPDSLTAARHDVVRLLLGLCASSLEVLPVSFTYAGTAEAPEGRADAIDVTGPAGFAARLFIGQADHLPLLVSWRTAGAPEGVPDTRLYLADYRDVQGLKLPFRIRRANGVVTTEETVIDRYRVNPTIDSRRFEVKP